MNRQRGRRECSRCLDSTRENPEGRQCRVYTSLSSEESELSQGFTSLKAKWLCFTSPS